MKDKIKEILMDESFTITDCDGNTFTGVESKDFELLAVKISSLLNKPMENISKSKNNNRYNSKTTGKGFFESWSNLIKQI